MNSKRRAALVGVAGAVMAATVTTAFAGSASAVVTEIDQFRIDTAGYDLAGISRSGSALVIWDQTPDGAIPSVRGTLHYNRVAATCARVRVDSYRLGHFSEGHTYNNEDGDCATDNSHQTVPVHVEAAPTAVEVLVTVEVLIDRATDTWADVGSTTVFYGPDVPVSEVKISRAELDFGGGDGLAGGVPVEPGLITWDTSGGWRVVPLLTGKLFMKNAENELARVRTRCFDAAGNALELGPEYSDEFFAPDDDLYTFDVAQGCSEPAVVEMTVAIERYDLLLQDWVQVGLTRAELPSVPIPNIGPIDLDPTFP